MEESLDVGCGSTKRASIGVDINRICKPDVVADAGTLPFCRKIRILIPKTRHDLIRVNATKID
jgi:hypothetical protein